MIMSWIFTLFLGISILFSLFLGNSAALASAIPEGAQKGITLALSMAGSVCLWTGVGRLLEKSGAVGSLARILGPVLRRIFPSTKDDPVLAGHLTANICANLLGLGNAATPMGLQAVRRMAGNAPKGRATDEMCRFIVLNTASIQLIPANVAAIRAGLGSAAPFDILPAVWVTSLCSAGMGLMAAWVFGRVSKHG